jgi:outer membrane protein assembly factor BamC
MILFHNRRRAIGFTCLAVAASLAGCGTYTNVFDSDKIDYKSSSASKPTSLEVPPDLTQVARDNRYQVPDTGRGPTTYSAYNQERGDKRPAASGGAALLPAAGDMRIERAASSCVAG